MKDILATEQRCLQTENFFSKQPKELMEDSGCRNAYIMKQVEPKGPYITYMYKVGAKLVYEGPLKGKSPRVVILKHSK